MSTMKPDGRKARWQAHRERRRAELVESTIQVIRKRGPAVGMDEIASEAGTSKPVFYRYFSDKADLYIAVERSVAEQVVGQISSVLDPDKDPSALVTAVVDTYLRFIESEPELYRFVMASPLPDKPVREDPVADYSTLVASHLAAIIGDRLRAAGLDSGAAEPWAHGLVGMVRTAGDWWMNRRTMSRTALTEYLTTLIWGGFAGMYETAGLPDPAKAAEPSVLPEGAEPSVP